MSASPNCLFRVVTYFRLLYFRFGMLMFVWKWKIFCRNVLVRLPPNEALIRITNLRWKLKDYPDDSVIANTCLEALDNMERHLKKRQEIIAKVQEYIKTLTNE